MKWKDFFNENKKLLLVIFVIWLLIFFVYGFIEVQNVPIKCWDGFNIDESLLMDLCGVTPEELNQIQNVNQSFCPEAKKAFKPVGGCEKQTSLAYGNLIMPLIIWVLILIVVVLVLKSFKKPKNPNP